MFELYKKRDKKNCVILSSFQNLLLVIIDTKYQLNGGKNIHIVEKKGS
jgi:hypothetical protein